MINQCYTDKIPEKKYMSGFSRLFENNEIAYIVHGFHDEFYTILVRVGLSSMLLKRFREFAQWRRRRQQTTCSRYLQNLRVALGPSACNIRSLSNHHDDANKNVTNLA